MVQYLTWVSLVACVVLCGACIVLYLDGRGQRQALATMRQVVDAHGAEIVDIRRMLAGLPALERHAEGLSMPFQPHAWADRSRPRGA